MKRRIQVATLSPGLLVTHYVAPQPGRRVPPAAQPPPYPARGPSALRAQDSGEQAPGSGQSTLVGQPVPDERQAPAAALVSLVDHLVGRRMQIFLAGGLTLYGVLTGVAGDVLVLASGGSVTYADLKDVAGFATLGAEPGTGRSGPAGPASPGRELLLHAPAPQRVPPASTRPAQADTVRWQSVQLLRCPCA